MTERSIFATSPPLSPSFTITVPDPDLEMGGGGQSSRLLDRGGRSPKNFFLPFGPQFGIKIWGGGGGGPYFYFLLCYSVIFKGGSHGIANINELLSRAQ